MHAVKMAPIMGAITGYIIDGATLIPLGTTIGLLLVVYQITKRWTSIENTLEFLKEANSSIKDTNVVLNKLVEQMQNRLFHVEQFKEKIDVLRSNVETINGQLTEIKERLIKLETEHNKFRKH